MVFGSFQRWTLLVSFAGVLVLCGSSQGAPVVNKTILLATTTSTRDSGLLDVLIPVFERRTGYQVKTIAVGTGKALAMGKRGDADILMTHAPAAEKPLVEAGWFLERVPFMYNDYILTGPHTDPGRVRLAQDAADAFKRIDGTKALFISRGDNSGTHKQEQVVWQSANRVPTGEWYQESGQGMAATLRIASEKDAYTLTDRSTYLNLQATLSSVILYADDPQLRNTYSIMLVNPARHQHVNADAARVFHRWLLSDMARDLIRNHGTERFGQPLFRLNLLP
jgi:tungstate transport system substrate-binding protein